jgi:hypothetical protein
MTPVECFAVSRAVAMTMLTVETVLTVAARADDKDRACADAIPRRPDRLTIPVV